MALDGARDLLAELGDHGILRKAPLEQARALLGQFTKAADLARELVRRGLLTKYQANEINQGRAAGLVLGPYLVLEPLGHGGMGEVFKGRHHDLDRLVALKLIRTEYADRPDTIERFRRECLAAARLSHPNIVLVYDAHLDGDLRYLAMEYIDGMDLGSVVKERGALPTAEACEYARQAALGLQHAHERGLVHRDVKPANLMRTADGATVKVLDLGLARLRGAAGSADADAGLTQQGAVMGTPDYLAPEQAGGDSAETDARADVYSLGCTLYRLLSGRPPFAGQTVREKIRAHLTRDALPLAQVQPGLPVGLDAVVRRMMAKEPADRFQTSAEVAAALAPFCREAGGGPMSSTPVKSAAPITATLPQFPAALPQIRMSSRRRRSIIAVAAAVLLLGVGLAGVLAWRVLAPPPSGKPDAPLQTALPPVEDKGRGKDPTPDFAAPRPTDPPPVGAPAKEITNSLGMPLTLIPPGKFLMGSPSDEIDRNTDEKQHEVEITQPFYMGVFEVTQEEYAQVIGDNPSSYSPNGNFRNYLEGKDNLRFPVENVSWFDAKEFCRNLSERAEEKRFGRLYRLPTEAEWEYSCRGGSRDPGPFFFDHPSASASANQANFRPDSPYGGAPKIAGFFRATTVGSYKPNGFGLYDMHGNVWEWCEDFYSEYPKEPQKDPKGPLTGPLRVHRGGSWLDGGGSCRAAGRGGLRPSIRNHNLGFRVVIPLRTP